MNSRVRSIVFFFLLIAMGLFFSSVYSTVYLIYSNNPVQFNTPFNSTRTVPGYVIATVAADRDDYFFIHNDGWATSTSWSGGVLFDAAGEYGNATNLPRRDQGNTNWARHRNPYPNNNGYLTVISVSNPTATTQKFGVLYTSYEPSYIIGASNDISPNDYYVTPQTNVKLFTHLDYNMLAVEYIMARWSTNNWINSGFVKASVSATATMHTNILPKFLSGSLVQYYMVSSAENASNFITNDDNGFVTISCASNQYTPFMFYVAGTHHQIAVDGTNDFNTNDVERFLTTTEGYTNWITWDSNYIYMGFYGQDIGSASSSKVLYVYFSTNTNTNNTTGTAYANAEGGQFPVLPFRANYFFRKTMSGEWSSGVWTNAAWNTNNSPLTAGISNRVSGNYLELRIHRTNFQNTTTVNLTNLLVLSYMMDISSTASNTYAGCPSSTFVDGYRANPSNYLNFSKSIWVSNQKPSSNLFVTNDIYPPTTNYIITPTNNQTNNIGDLIVLSNFAADSTGIYKIEVYSQTFGLYDTIWVSNTNSVYTLNIDSGDFLEGEEQFYTIAYDTHHGLKSQNVTVFLKYSGTVYLPGSGWDMGEFNSPFTNLYMPPGFVKRRVSAQLNDYLLIHRDGWNTNTSWSAGTLFTDYQRTWTINRNDKGNTNWARLGGSFPATTRYLTVVSAASPTGTNQKFGIMYTTGVPVRITDVSSDIAAYANSNYAVNITINVAKDPLERIMVRFTTNSWTNSMAVEASGSGTAYTALVPPMRSGTEVRYYVMNTTAPDLYVTNGDHNYVTLSCYSNQIQPFSYYVSGTYHTIRVDGTNDFNTNGSEMLLATTSGYTNWVTWDADYLYLGYYGDALNDNNADKIFYVYFGTNTNSVTNLNLITGSSYGEPQGSQYPVLPFNANYFFRYVTTGSWDTAVWTNNSWNSNVSPLETGLSNVRIGKYLEMRIPKTNFNSSPNLNILTFMLDKVSGNEKIYGGVPGDTFVDGNSSNPSNYLSFRGNVCVSNVYPSSSDYRTNDTVVPYTNALLWPEDGQSFSVGTPIQMTNFARDENGIYKIEFYTNTGGLYTNIYVTNTNATFIVSLDTSNFIADTFSFYTIAYDTKNAYSSPTNLVSFIFTGFVYMPHTGGLGQFDTPFTNLYMPPGFVKRTEFMSRGNYLMIHRDGWNSNSSWSAGTLLTAFQTTWEINRWDQGNTNWARLRLPFPGSDYLTVVAYANPSATTEKFGFMNTAGNPIHITAVSGNEKAFANSNYTVSITLSAAKSAEERIVLRYTTNDWATSMTVTATGAGTAYTAVIPAMNSGSLVRYYAMTTTASSTYITNGDHNYVTISCFSNEMSPFEYYVSGTLHTIDIDGVNDFNTNDAEMFLTSTSGYTNWMTWDATNFYFGYYGADISANDTNKMLYIYLGTNTNLATNLNLITGNAYGEPQETQSPVLPFNANYFLRYTTTHAWETAVWTNNAWYSNVSPLASGLAVGRSGNYVEMKIPRTNFMNQTTGSFPNLYVLAFMLDKKSKDETIYGAVPGNSLQDGFMANPSNYIRFGPIMWVSNIMPSTNIYVTNDAIAPYTNRLLTPVNFLTNYIGATITLSNFARDNTGVYKLEVYTNNGALLDTIWVTNTNANYFYDIVTTNFGSGTYKFYTLAYDTFNVRSSQTNTNITFRTGADMSIYKSVSSIQLMSTNLLQPGALITYQLLYTNTGPLTGSNVVIYDRIPDHTTYYTNYPGTATGWTVQFAHVENPDQSYESTDYDLNPASVTWFRWIKEAVGTAESGSTLFLGVTVD